MQKATKNNQVLHNIEESATTMPIFSYFLLKLTTSGIAYFKPGFRPIEEI